jgi:predicted CoA-substrate-specific enzyme activase
MRNGKKFFAGLDIGSTTSKAVLFNEDRVLISDDIIDTKFDREASGKEVLENICKKFGIERSELDAIGITGYGRYSYKDAQTIVPEILCHANGTEFMAPGVKTIIDIGGQDNKVIEVDNGSVTKFEMNDKCAAGTGRFYEVLSHRLLNVGIDELGTLALKSTHPVTLSSMCTVFAESEVVSYLSQGTPMEDICRGILISSAKRIRGMSAAARVNIREPIVLSGGIALNAAAAPVFSEIFGKTITSLDKPQLSAAIGVALFAIDQYEERCQHEKNT